MKDLFDEREAQEFVKRYPSLPDALALRLYTSRLIGKDPGLVLQKTLVQIQLREKVGTAPIYGISGRETFLIG